MSAEGQVWNAKRRWLGNLLPLMFWLPPTAAGIFLAVRGDNPIGLPLGLLVLGQVLGWLGVNFLSASFNKSMKQELAVRESRHLPEIPTRATFVGMATPKFKSLLDPHEDVGLLYILDDRLSYIGERYRMDVPRTSVTTIAKRGNIHSWLGLGFWVSVEGMNHGKAYGLFLEVREQNSTRANRRQTGQLLEQLRAWQNRPS